MNLSRNSLCKADKPIIGVFTVKKFKYVDGKYWTYGGFGDYIKSLIPHFRKIIIACHPIHATEVPKGWYSINEKKLIYAWLPYYEREDQCLIKLPVMLFKAWKIVKIVDIVNARVPDYSGLCGLFWARLIGKPLFINIVGDWHNWRNIATRLHGLMKFGLQIHFMVYSLIERILCSNQLTFVQGKHIFKIYCRNVHSYECVSSSHYERDIVKTVKKISNQKIVRLLAVGRLVFLKGHRDLILCLKILKEKDPEHFYELTIVGEGKDYREYRKLSNRIGVDNQLHLIGQVSREDIFSYYDKADLFCLPSYSEGTPKVVLEAMARGVPVISTDVGGVSGLITHRVSGLLVSPGNPGEMAKRIMQIINDKALYKKCSFLGLSIARKHTVKTEFGMVLKIIKNHYPKLWATRG